MPTRKVWEVDIEIVGPISISNSISFKQEKGFNPDQFYSDIKLSNSPLGISSTVTAYADDSNIANTVAYVFFGRMIDVLALDSNIPLVLQAHDSLTNFFTTPTTRRLFEKEDFMVAFKVARRLEIEHPRLLKAIGWYSKGKTSNNTLDKFLAYWNAIEIIGTTYYTKTARTTGTINMIYQCFLDYFGDESNWGVPSTWINDMHGKRSRIAHGAEETTVEAINAVNSLIPAIESMSHKLIYSVLRAEYPTDIFEQAYIQSLF